jgi:hypothetical protein
VPDAVQDRTKGLFSAVVITTVHQERERPPLKGRDDAKFRPVDVNHPCSVVTPLKKMLLFYLVVLALLVMRECPLLITVDCCGKASQENAKPD